MIHDPRKVILFGAGQVGKRALEQLGRERVVYYIDNNPKSHFINDVPVYNYEDGISARNGEIIVVTVSQKYKCELVEQLKKSGIKDIFSLQDVLAEITREKIENRTDYIALYQKAIGWILKNTADGKGIINNTGLPKPYPEVSGYYIPTLISWGYRELAIQYARWLCSIQKDDGSWWDTDDKQPYVFDTGQILKGLISVRRLLPEVDTYIIRGCDWIISNIEENGRFHQAHNRTWDDASGWSNELIHLYCLSPVIKAAEIFDRDDYRAKAQLSKNYYITNYRDDILSFDLLSHFYAYIMEALLDIGEIDLAKEAMDKIRCIQKEDGSVPGLKDVNWVCSTGLFQLALVWYRLGEIECGDKAFVYACKLQNDSGGWYGSYVHQDYPDEIAAYFPDREISWAVKYFLDALQWKNRALFDKEASSFQIKYNDDDGRVMLVSEQISEAHERRGRALKICDAGCGKGAYIRILKKKYQNDQFYGVDISEAVMSYMDPGLAEIREGSLTCFPFDDNELDVVYACESLEHAIDIESAVREMARVTKPGGRIIVIDKDKVTLGRMEIEEWEQWFDVEELKCIMSRYCSDVEVKHNVSYGECVDNLFCGWIGTVDKA